MTADAKVGLLLGLLFIGMIAFLLNAVPNIPKMTKADEVVSVRSEMPQEEPIVIGDRITHTAHQLQQNDIPIRRTDPPREEIILDGSGQGTVIEPERSQQADQDRSVSPIPVTPQPQRAVVRTHTVQRGDNLAEIAQKYYGAEEGNRRVVIQKLFEANKSTLPSPDKIRVGQKLTIPPLDRLMNASVQPVVNTPQPQGERTIMQRFSDLFEPSDREIAETAAAIHVVQSGESLWGIAETTLGDGKRYKEILELNRVIKDADDVVTGMRLKLPAN